VLLSDGSASTLERGDNVHNLGLGINRLEIRTRLSVYAFNIVQGHITYLCARAVLQRTGCVVVRERNTSLTYEGFLHLVDGLVECVARSRRDSGGWSALVVDHHL